MRLRRRKAKTNAAVMEEVEAAFDELCSNLNIRINGKSLYFPERIVKLITVNQTQLKQLLAPAIDENCVQALEPQWGTADNDRHGGHGTEMAGIALFYDLKDALLDEGEAVIAHEIESVKILPPNGENPRALYGEKRNRRR